MILEYILLIKCFTRNFLCHIYKALNRPVNQWLNRQKKPPYTLLYTLITKSNTKSSLRFTINFILPDTSASNTQLSNCQFTYCRHSDNSLALTVFYQDTSFSTRSFIYSNTKIKL